MSTVTDDMKAHISESVPRDNQDSVALGTSIVVVFDRDVRTVNISRLFEVCV